MTRVSVLMSTFNGEKFLREQLDSVLAQRGVGVQLLVRDDHSADSTTKILDEYKAEGFLDWYTGDRLGPGRSFLDLMKHAPSAHFYAFCDQDDVWDPSKLAAAIDKLLGAPADMPALYFSSMELVDEKLEHISTHMVRNRRLDFAKFIFAGEAGCTMVFNHPLLVQCNSATPYFFRMHDIWVFDVCMALGGILFADEESRIKYRQHASNVLGIKRRSWLQAYKAYVSKSKVALHMQSLLDCFSDRMLPDYRALASDLACCNHSLPARFRLLFSPRIRFRDLGLQILFALKVILGEM